MKYADFGTLLVLFTRVGGGTSARPVQKSPFLRANTTCHGAFSMAISQVCEHGFEQNVLTLWWAIFLSVFPQKWNIVVSLFFLKITKMWSKVPRFFEQDFETFWCKCALLGRQSVTPDGKRRTGCIETSLIFGWHVADFPLPLVLNLTGYSPPPCVNHWQSKPVWYLYPARPTEILLRQLVHYVFLDGCVHLCVIVSFVIKFCPFSKFRS